MEPERRQRPALERLGASDLLLQGFRGCVLPGDDPQTDALERGSGCLRRGQEADAFVIGPACRVVRLAPRGRRQFPPPPAPPRGGAPGPPPPEGGPGRGVSSPHFLPPPN